MRGMSVPKSSDETKRVMREVLAFTGTMRANRKTIDFVSDSTGASLSTAEHFASEALKEIPDRPFETHKDVGRTIEAKVSERHEIATRATAGDLPTDQLNSALDEWEAQLKRAIGAITGDENDYYRYNRIWRRRAEITRTSRTLYGSLLITAVSDFEALVAGLVRSFLALRPEILKASSKSYTFKDLSDFGSIEEFRLHCSEVRADEILRQGFDQWMKWFSEDRKVGVREVTDDNASLAEIFQRRHLLVHNGGVVNSHYLGKTNGDQAVVDGQKLKVNEAYLRESLDVLTISGVKLGIATLRKVLKGEDALHKAGAYLHRIAYDSLVDRAWRVAYDLSVWQDEAGGDASMHLTSKVNAWLAAKQMENFANVRAEIEAWDTRTLANRFRVAKAALLDDNESAYGLARSMVGTEELSEREWRYWPLLEGVREYEAKNVHLADRLWAGSYDDLSSEVL